VVEDVVGGLVEEVVNVVRKVGAELVLVVPVEVTPDVKDVLNNEGVGVPDEVAEVVDCDTPDIVEVLLAPPVVVTAGLPVPPSALIPKAKK
jgi:hypothetical protein